MLEKRKEESESMGKYQTMLMSAIVAAIIVFLAPTLIVVLTNQTIPDGQTAEDVLFAPPTVKQFDDDGNLLDDERTVLPSNLTNQISGLFSLLLWFVRIVLVAMIIVSVMMLYVRDARR